MKTKLQRIKAFDKKIEKGVRSWQKLSDLLTRFIPLIMKSKRKFPGISGVIKVNTEIYDIIYNDIMHCWALLPKDDFWVCRQFISASIDYLHSLADIRKHYEERQNPNNG